MVLNQQEITELIKKRGLIKNYIDLEKQLTPNGFDLTVSSVSEFDVSGSIDFSNREREIPVGKKILPERKNPHDRFGWWLLKNGSYKTKTNETISLPKDLIAVSFSRSSLLRMGVSTQTGVWDAGFSGESEFIITVKNPKGLKLKQNARIIQLIFIRMKETYQGYRGIYQQKCS